MQLTLELMNFIDTMDYVYYLILWPLTFEVGVVIKIQYVFIHIVIATVQVLTLKCHTLFPGISINLVFFSSKRPANNIEFNFKHIVLYLFSLFSSISNQ